MKFAIIGSGMIAQFHAAAIAAIPDAHLVAVASRNGHTSQALASIYRCASYLDAEEMLQSEEIDIITIATPSGAHLEPCLLAARYRKHVICEKPLEITPERIQRMISACREAGVVLSGILNRRFNPAVEAFKKAVDRKRFGQQALCSAYVKWFRDEHYYNSAAWRGTKSLDGGGALMNQGIHTVDVLLHLAGPVSRVTASTTNVLHHHIEVEDTAVALLEFASGARGVIEATTAAWSEQGHPAEIQIVGSRGSVHMKDDYFSVWNFDRPDPEDEKIKSSLMGTRHTGLGANDPKAINTIGHERNFIDVMQAIHLHRPPSISAYEALPSVRLICAIYESAASAGKWIEL